MRESVLSYYERHLISTEHGVDADWGKHVARRKKLYRQLGIPLLTFRESDVLEIGPGAGHNSLPLLTEWGVKHIDLVEPNGVAREELYQKFEENNVPSHRYTVYAETMERFKPSRKYDVLITEGIIHGMDNWREWMTRLADYAHENSVIIVTCMNEIGCYVEKMKRVILQYITREITDHKEKVAALKVILEPQLQSLNGMSRSAEDWIEDQILAPCFLKQDCMTMGMAIEYYKDDFDVLGSSQNIFVDHSWYKDINYDYIASYINQYNEKKHMFLLAGDSYEVCRTIEENHQLEDAVVIANDIARKVEEENIGIEELKDAVINVSKNTDNSVIIDFNIELVKIIDKINNNDEIDWSEYQTFTTSFGKTMQYISFMKR